MKIIWNKVTWYSKLLAVFVFAGAIWLGICFTNQYKEIRMIGIDSAPVAVDTSDWKTYKNEKYGFEFKYQKDLFLTGSLENGEVLFLANYDIEYGEGRSYDPDKDKGKFKIDISYRDKLTVSSSTPIFFANNGIILRLFLDTDAGANTFREVVSTIKFTK